jgi:hypothetical protein
VEAKLRTHNATWEWLPGDNLRVISPVLAAVRHDDGPGRSGRKTFFNSVVAVYTGWNDSRNKGETAVQFADGTYIDPAVMQEVLKLMEEMEVAFVWRKGDVVLIDNRTVMHSRKPFKGERIITASLATHPTR